MTRGCPFGTIDRDLAQSFCRCETDQFAVPPVHVRSKADLRAQADAVFEYCLGRAERKQ